MISIINQIQASITGEAIDGLDRYDEMQCGRGGSLRSLYFKCRSRKKLK
jgi:hypothetical protein